MTTPLNFRARRRERERQAALQVLTEHRNRLRKQYFAAIDLVDEVDRMARAELDENAAALAEAVEVTVRPEVGAWSGETWSNWRADTTAVHPEVRIGSMVAPDGTDLGLPVVVGLDCTSPPVVLVSHTAEQRAVARDLLGSLVIRLSACFPKQLRLALLDPADLGATFPMSRRLERVLLGLDDVHGVIDELRAEIDRISSTYLDRHHPDFDSLPHALRLGESHQVMLAASVPTGYDSHALDALLDVATNGPRAGVHSFVHVDLETGDAARSTLDRLVELGATIIDLAGTPLESDGVTGTVAFDDVPSGAVQELVLRRIAAAPRRDTPILWRSLQEFGPDGYWQDITDDVMATAVGRAGTDEAYDVWFGHDPDTARTCTHGIVIGGAPTGRQFVFDNILAGFTANLPPDELRLFLVESHEHPSFAPWKTVPHAEVVALAPSPEQARNALAELRAACERRIADLQRSGHSTYRARRQDGSQAAMPRWLVVIDGYEQLFEHDTDDRAVEDLRTVISLGEQAGVHVLLGGGRFDATAPLHRAGIFDELDLRIALQPFADDTLGRDEFGIKGARLVQRVCDRPFRAVINSTRGHDDANLAMQLAVLDPNQRDLLVAELVELAREERLPTRAAHVMNGSEQPQLIDNPHLRRLLELPRTPQAVAEFARSSAANGGLGVDDWIDEEHPVLMFIGQEETLHGQAHFVLRRRPTENVLVVMSDRNLRMGTLAALMVSSALVDREDVEFWIADRGATGTPAGEALEHAVRRIARLDIPCRYTRSGDESAEFVATVASEVARRRTLDEHEVSRQTTCFLVLVDPERIPALNRVPTAQGTTDSELGLQLRYVLMQGPAVGVHVILTSAAMAALATVIAEPVIHHDLRHRLVTKVAEEDSFALVRSSRAATLAAGNGHATAALLFDSHTQNATTFKPYSVAGSETGRVGPMSAQLTKLFDELIEEVEA